MTSLTPTPPPDVRIGVKPQADPAGSLNPTAASHRPERAGTRRSPAPSPRRPAGRRGAWVALFIGAAVGAGAFGLLRRDSRPLEVVSGRATPRQTPSGAAERWRHDQITVTFDRSLNALGQWAEDEVAQGFGTWLVSSPTLPHFQFDDRPAAPVSLEPDGENRVYYAPIPIKGHEGDLAVTLSFANERTGEILESDIIINARRPFGQLIDSASPASDDEHSNKKRSANDDSDASLGVSANQCASRYDLRSVVTHEIGHFLGLGEDFEDPAATMYFRTGKCDAKQRDLDPVDVESISVLYSEGFPSPDSQEVASAGCSVASGSTPKPATPMTVAVFAVALVVCERRRRRHRWS